MGVESQGIPQKESVSVDQKKTPKVGNGKQANPDNSLGDAQKPRRNNRNNRYRRRNDAKDKSAVSQSSTNSAKRQNSSDLPPMRRAVYSAIDLGTNNCRLLIAKPTNKGFRVIDAFSRIVRLGEGVSTSGEMSQEAMDRTVEALKICSDKIKRRGVTCMHHVATEACRIATNTPEFLERVRRETGINLDVISTAEEARLAVMGCQSLIAPGNKHALVFDIGGGSTELIWVRVNGGKGTEIKAWTSVPWGVVNLTESFGRKGAAVGPGDFDAMVSEVKKHMHEFEDACEISKITNQRRIQFLGTSGTVTTLASLHLNLARYDRSKVDGAWMKAKDIRELSNRVARMTHIERAAQPCIGEDRADLVVAGCAILEAILGMWQVRSLRVADRGIREGILRSLMQVDKPPRANWRNNR